MEIETAFAAALVNAARYAAIARKHGHAQTSADQVDCALMELWETGRSDGMASSEIQGIADKYLDYADGEPRVRPMGNVVPFGR